MTEYDKKIPRSAVKERQGLSYVDQHYVISRLNEVFGHDGWSFRKVSGEWVHFPAHTGEKNRRGKDLYFAAYECTVEIEALGCVRQGSAVGHTTTTSYGECAHFTIGEAETDALKRAARLFGQTFGLALYDKDQKFVEDEKPKRKSRKKGPDPAELVAFSALMENGSIKDRVAAIALYREAFVASGVDKDHEAAVAAREAIQKKFPKEETNG